MNDASSDVSEADEAPTFRDDEIASMRASLLEWYDRHRRDLPWRDIDDPYATWVAEIMLQQTQVSTVVDYYERWLERFPDVESVAEAERETILEMWEGLGYYRRARYLHRSAREIVEERDGQLPQTAGELEELPGIGPYTAGAIASIAFDEATPVVDGNVARVLSRLRAIEGEPNDPDNKKLHWRLAEQLVAPDRPGDFNQAMMELGATVCTPQGPNCLICPVREHCRGFETGHPEQYPEPASRPNQKAVSAATAVVLHRSSGGDAFAVLKRPPEGLLGGLWEFPTVELEDSHEEPSTELDAYLRDTLGLPEVISSDERVEVQSLDEVTHLFSHIRLSLTVYLHVLEAEARPELSEIETDRPCQWVTRDELEDLPMSMAMRRVEQLAFDALETPPD